MARRAERVSALLLAIATRCYVVIAAACHALCAGGVMETEAHSIAMDSIASAYKDFALSVPFVRGMVSGGF